MFNHLEKYILHLECAQNSVFSPPSALFPNLAPKITVLKVLYVQFKNRYLSTGGFWYVQLRVTEKAASWCFSEKKNLRGFDDSLLMPHLHCLMLSKLRMAPCPGTCMWYNQWLLSHISNPWLYLHVTYRAVSGKGPCMKIGSMESNTPERLALAVEALQLAQTCSSFGDQECFQFLQPIYVGTAGIGSQSRYQSSYATFWAGSLIWLCRCLLGKGTCISPPHTLSCAMCCQIISVGNRRLDQPFRIWSFGAVKYCSGI